MFIIDSVSNAASQVKQKGLAPIILAGVLGSACLLFIVYRPFFRRRILKGIEVSNEVSVQLRRKIMVGQNTYKLTFDLSQSNSILGLPIGQHLQVVARVPEISKTVIHSYTPTSYVNQEGYFDLVVKEYKPNLPTFPEGGILSQYICGLSVGDWMTIRGPKGNVEYKGNGHMKITVGKITKLRHFKSIGMICGGTGITPMFQIAQEIIADPKDNTKISILFANKTPNDVLMKNELDILHNKGEGQVKIFYTVDEVDGQSWDHFVGYVNESTIKATIPEPSNNTLIMLCGPALMVKDYLPEILTRIGYTAEQIVTF